MPESHFLPACKMPALPWPRGSRDLQAVVFILLQPCGGSKRGGGGRWGAGQTPQQEPAALPEAWREAARHARDWISQHSLPGRILGTQLWAWNGVQGHRLVEDAEGRGCSLA